MEAVNLDWQNEALCREVELDIFFPKPPVNHEPAKRVCRLCPVIDECLNFALETDQVHGVWGGWSPRRRRVYLNRLGR